MLPGSGGGQTKTSVRNFRSRVAIIGAGSGCLVRLSYLNVSVLKKEKKGLFALPPSQLFRPPLSPRCRNVSVSVHTVNYQWGCPPLRGSWMRGCRGGMLWTRSSSFFYEREEEMELEVELVLADYQI